MLSLIYPEYIIPYLLYRRLTGRKPGLLKSHMAQLRRAACGGKKGKKERGVACGRAMLFLSFGVGWETHSATFEKLCKLQADYWRSYAHKHRHAWWTFALAQSRADRIGRGRRDDNVARHSIRWGALVQECPCCAVIEDVWSLVRCCNSATKLVS